ncbi:hypothetical protein, partial [Clostridium perfringens]
SGVKHFISCILVNVYAPHCVFSAFMALLCIVASYSFTFMAYYNHRGVVLAVCQNKIKVQYFHVFIGRK